jgi:hypothetical protein
MNYSSLPYVQSRTEIFWLTDKGNKTQLIELINGNVITKDRPYMKVVLHFPNLGQESKTLIAIQNLPVTMATRIKASTAFGCSNIGIVCSNLTRGMNVCVYSVFVLSCVQVVTLWRADPSSKESYRLCKRSRNWKSGQGPTKGCRVLVFLLVSRRGVRLSTSATNWPTVPAPDDDECGAVGGMRIGTGNRSTRRKAAPLPLCPPQIPHDLTYARTWAAAVWSRLKNLREIDRFRI